MIAIKFFIIKWTICAFGINIKLPFLFILFHISQICKIFWFFCYFNFNWNLNALKVSFSHLKMFFFGEAHNTSKCYEFGHIRNVLIAFDDKFKYLLLVKDVCNLILKIEVFLSDRQIHNTQSNTCIWDSCVCVVCSKRCFISILLKKVKIQIKI